MIIIILLLYILIMIIYITLYMKSISKYNELIKINNYKKYIETKIIEIYLIEDNNELLNKINELIYFINNIDKKIIKQLDYIYQNSNTIINHIKLMLILHKRRELKNKLINIVIIPNDEYYDDRIINEYNIMRDEMNIYEYKISKLMHKLNDEIIINIKNE